MAEKNVYADAIGKHLLETSEYRLKEKEVLVIHTDSTGEVLKGDLDTLREKARDIDKPGNAVKVIVSVMMLREGVDVLQVSVVLGLRPFTAKAEILPEQVIGRGLRLMGGAIPDRTQSSRSSERRTSSTSSGDSSKPMASASAWRRRARPIRS